MTTMIRPGILVSVKSTVSGGVAYKRQVLDVNDREAKTEAGSVEKWETTKFVIDPEEHERATKVRGNALAQIRQVCAHTAFGLLCPENLETELDGAIQMARAMVTEHNNTAQHTKVQIYAIKGRIASTDEEAARAIGDEVKNLLDSMNGAIDRLDPKAIREAADKAKEMAAMLAPEQSETVGEAIKQARKAARMIVSRIEKEGEAAEFVLKDIQRGAIEKARFAFLDFEDTVEVEGEALPQVQPRQLDMASGDEVGA